MTRRAGAGGGLLDVEVLIAAEGHRRSKLPVMDIYC